MKYIYNPVTNDLDEIEKIPDLEDRLEKGIADKEARDSGWKDTKELEDYLSRDTSGSKGAWDKYVKETAHNEKVDQEIVNFGDNFQPNKKPRFEHRNPVGNLFETLMVPYLFDF